MNPSKDVTLNLWLFDFLSSFFGVDFNFDHQMFGSQKLDHLALVQMQNYLHRPICYFCRSPEHGQSFPCQMTRLT